MKRGGVSASIVLGTVLTCAAAARAQTTAPRHRADANVAEGSRVGVTLFADVSIFVPSTLAAHRTLSVDAIAAPRFWLGRGVQLRAAFGMTALVSNAETTAATPVFLSDLSVTLWHHGVPRFGDFYPAFAAGLRAPTSEASRAQTMVVGTDLGAQLVWWRPVDAVSWFARASLWWSHDVFQYTTPLLRTAWRPPCFAASVTDDGCTGARVITAVGAVSWSLLFAPRWRWISPGVSFGMSHAYVAGTGATPSIAALTRTHFAAWVEFIPHAVFSVLLSYAVGRPLLDAGGGVGNPLGSDAYPGVLGLAVTFRIDALADAARGQPPGPGGVVWW
ncbi:MAG: hypothetical protein U0325_11060 [Polyangiales bacterium]